jgi:hypothetical protein
MFLKTINYTCNIGDDDHILKLCKFQKGVHHTNLHYLKVRRVKILFKSQTDKLDCWEVR